jgi:fumarate hydratase subunit beta
LRCHQAKNNFVGSTALTLKCVRKIEIVAYEDLEPEVIKGSAIVDLSFVLIDDSKDNNLFLYEQDKWCVPSM